MRNKTEENGRELVTKTLGYVDSMLILRGYRGLKVIGETIILVEGIMGSQSKEIKQLTDKHNELWE